MLGLHLLANKQKRCYTKDIIKTANKFFGDYIVYLPKTPHTHFKNASHSAAEKSEGIMPVSFGE